MGFLSFIGKLLGLGRRFQGSPEQFLAMVEFMAYKNNPNFTPTELLQWGDVMQKMMKTDLHPFKNFGDLVANGKADYTLVQKVEGKLQEHQQRKDLKQAIYGEQVDLGDDDVMKSNSESAVFARQFVKDMSKHVNFSEEDQKIVDGL